MGALDQFIENYLDAVVLADLRWCRLITELEELSGDKALEAANDLYWNFPEVRVSEIARALKIVPREFKPWPLGMVVDECVDCHTKTQRARTSRSMQGKTFLCDDCRQNRTNKFHAWQEASQEQVQALAAMPYREYLQTDHWKEMRRVALRRARYRCQLCHANTPLNVHHRTYERRGCEEPSDLIALCEPCHRKFHDIKE